LKLVEVINPNLLAAILRKVALRAYTLSGKLEKVCLSEIKLSGPRHSELPHDLIGRIRLIRAALVDIYPLSMEQWIDGFRRDAHPTSEVAVWEGIASRYLELEHDSRTMAEHRPHIFNALLYASMQSVEGVTKACQQLPEELAGVVFRTIDADKPINDSDRPALPFAGSETETENDPNLDKDVFDGPEANISRDLIERLARNTLPDSRRK
jgi:hypothetical protein